MALWIAERWRDGHCWTKGSPNSCCAYACWKFDVAGGHVQGCSNQFEKPSPTEKGVRYPYANLAVDKPIAGDLPGAVEIYELMITRFPDHKAETLRTLGEALMDLVSAWRCFSYVLIVPYRLKMTSPCSLTGPK